MQPDSNVTGMHIEIGQLQTKRYLLFFTPNYENIEFACHVVRNCFGKYDLMYVSFKKEGFLLVPESTLLNFCPNIRRKFLREIWRLLLEQTSSHVTLRAIVHFQQNKKFYEKIIRLLSTNTHLEQQKDVSFHEYYEIDISFVFSSNDTPPPFTKMWWCDVTHYKLQYFLNFFRKFPGMFLIRINNRLKRKWNAHLSKTRLLWKSFFDKLLQ